MRLLILIVVFALPAVGNAQLSEVAAGSRLRVTAPAVSKQRLVGTLVKPIGDSVMLDLRTRAGQKDSSVARYSIPIQLVERLEISGGKSYGAGAKRGAQIGALVAGLVAVVLIAPEIGNPTGDRKGIALIAGGLIAGLGAVGGVIVGGNLGVETWRDVQLPSPPVR